MSTALAIKADTMGEWEVIREQASILVKTGFLPQSIKTPEQAMAIILTGRELGIGTMAALNTINVIQGKPTISPQLMLALINRSGQLEDLSFEITPDGCATTMKRKGRSPYTAHFGFKEASAMGLHTKDNYKKQAPTMYKWRSVADAARAIFPDVILGLYTPDEMGANVNEDGEAIDAIPEPSPLRVVEPEPEEKSGLDSRRSLLKEMVAELKARGVTVEQIRERVESLCDGNADFRALSDGDVDGLNEEFSRWLDVLADENSQEE